MHVEPSFAAALAACGLALSAAAGAQVQITNSPALASEPTIVAHGTDLYMAVDTGSGRQLHRFSAIWRTTTAIVDAATSLPVTAVQQPTIVGSRVFFKGNAVGGAPNLFVHDPALGDTATRLHAGGLDPLYLTGSGNQVFFSGAGPGGREPWASDGTLLGTRRVQDLHASGDSNPQDFVAFGSGVIFRANNGTNGAEPWFSDGITCTLLEVYPSGSSSPSEFVVAGGYCYFSATNGSSGRELCRTNGTPAGTVLIDIDGGTPGSDPTGLAAVGNDVYFAANGGIGHGTELWRIMGSTGAVTEVANIRPNSNSSNPSGIRQAGPFVYFTAISASANGRELFAYDPSTGAFPTELTVQAGSADGVRADPHVTPLDGAGAIVFEGNAGPSGWEPWTTNGGPVTNLVNLALSGSSNPEQFTLIGNEVFFVGTDNTGNGVQVWAVPLGGVPSAIWSARGTGCPRVGGVVPTASLTAPMRLGTTTSLVVDGAPSQGLVANFASTGPGAALLGSCTVLMAGGPGLPFSLPMSLSNPAGVAALPITIPPTISWLGLRFSLQSLVVESGGAMLGLGALTNAVDVVIGT